MKRLTVAEYAELYNISVQAVYKKLDRLETVEEVRNGRTVKLVVIDEDGESKTQKAIKPDSTQKPPDLNPKFQPIKPFSTSDSTPSDSTSTPDIKPFSTPDSTIAYLSILEKQLDEKDKQIERLQEENREKDKQLQEQFERLTQLLYHSQQLEALTHKLLGDGEEETQEQGSRQEEKLIHNEPPQKQSWFKRLFKW